MQFSFENFISNLEMIDGKTEIIKKYKDIFGICPDVRNCDWYTDYVKKFQLGTIQFNCGNQSLDTYDYNLLSELVFASLSNDFSFKIENGLFEVYISIDNDDLKVTRKISELYSFQIIRLLEIYIEEQITLSVLSYENVSERKEILDAREKRFRLFIERKEVIQLHFNSIDFHKEISVRLCDSDSLINRVSGNLNIDSNRSQLVNTHCINLSPFVYDALQQAKYFFPVNFNEDIITDEGIIYILIKEFVAKLSSDLDFSEIDEDNIDFEDLF